jgi:hypothetical protein
MFFLKKKLNIIIQLIIFFFIKISQSHDPNHKLIKIDPIQFNILPSQYLYKKISF